MSKRPHHVVAAVCRRCVVRVNVVSSMLAFKLEFSIIDFYKGMWKAVWRANIVFNRSDWMVCVAVKLVTYFMRCDD
jgi:hypothetical protein